MIIVFTDKLFCLFFLFYLIFTLEVTCNRPRDPTLYDWRNWDQRVMLRDTVRYSCRGGYKRTGGATEATCTRDGWRPNPLCQAILSHCAPPPKVANAVVVTSRQKEYTSGSEATYQCRDQYTIKGVATVTCINGTWGERNFTCTCTYIQKHLKLLQMYQTEYTSGSKVTYQCRESIYNGGSRQRLLASMGNGRRESLLCSPTRTYIQKHFTK
uniref:Complement factor H like 1 n=1 Tax=Seriola dumerili TaxID=41447 RepID=A0A3B4VEY9_SERDU